MNLRKKLLQLWDNSSEFYFSENGLIYINAIHVD